MKGRPWKLMFTQEFATIHEARIIELKLKKLKRKDYIKQIIDDGIIKLSGRGSAW